MTCLPRPIWEVTLVHGTTPAWGGDNSFFLLKTYFLDLTVPFKIAFGYFSEHGKSYIYIYIYIYIENNLLPSVVANHLWVAATQPNTAIRSTGKRIWVIPLSRRWTNVRSHVVTMAGHDTSGRGHMTHVKAGPQTDTPTHAYFPARWVCFFPH
jgi:hypothetical protein